MGFAKGAFRSSAACCAEETGLLTSLMLSTFPKSTMDLLIPLTVPVNVGFSSGAFNAIDAVKVPAKSLSLPNAWAISFNVSNVVGAVFIKPLTTAFT